MSRKLKNWTFLALLLFFVAEELQAWDCLINQKKKKYGAEYRYWVLANYIKTPKFNHIICRDKEGNDIYEDKRNLNAVINIRPIKSFLKEGMIVLAPITRDDYGNEVFAEVKITKVFFEGDFVYTTAPICRDLAPPLGVAIVDLYTSLGYERFDATTFRRSYHPYRARISNSKTWCAGLWRNGGSRLSIALSPYWVKLCGLGYKGSTYSSGHGYLRRFGFRSEYGTIQTCYPSSRSYHYFRINYDRIIQKVTFGTQSWSRKACGGYELFGYTSMISTEIEFPGFSWIDVRIKGHRCEGIYHECPSRSRCSDHYNFHEYWCTCYSGYQPKPSASGSKFRGGDRRYRCVDVNECLAKRCRNGATCKNTAGSYSCACTTGWRGRHCDKDINECSAHPCKNKGTCTNTYGSYKCACVAGWKGHDCDIDVDECLASLCNNRGTCINNVGSYTCICTAGWQGHLCDKDIDECLAHPCKNKGTCTNTYGSYKCACVAGWKGQDCDIDVDECLANPCHNRGTCTNNVGSYTCACTAGWQGHDCEKDVDECLAHPCKNQATCSNTIGSYTCACAGGWQGQDCDVDVDECRCSAYRPCHNEGTCYNTAGLYMCACKAGWQGQECHLDVDECLAHPCKNQGTCTNTIGSYTCACVAGWKGHDCDIDVEECLVNNPCQNEGTCTNTVGSYTCTCTAGWQGHDCDRDIIECSRHPCENRGTCTNTIGSYICACVAGWKGHDCDVDVDECLANPCHNGGTCINNVGSYTCNCTASWHGNNCVEELLQGLMKYKRYGLLIPIVLIVIVSIVLSSILYLSKPITIPEDQQEEEEPEETKESTPGTGLLDVALERRRQMKKQRLASSTSLGGSTPRMPQNKGLLSNALIRRRKEKEEYALHSATAEGLTTSSSFTQGEQDKSQYEFYPGSMMEMLDTTGSSMDKGQQETDHSYQDPSTLLAHPERAGSICMGHTTEQMMQESQQETPNILSAALARRLTKKDQYEETDKISGAVAGHLAYEDPSAFLTNAELMTMQGFSLGFQQETPNILAAVLTGRQMEKGQDVEVDQISWAEEEVQFEHRDQIKDHGYDIISGGEISWAEEDVQLKDQD